MDNFWIQILINIIIGFIVFGGFFIFWGRSAGWFVEGGFVYEYFQRKKSAKRKRKKSKHDN